MDFMIYLPMVQDLITLGMSFIMSFMAVVVFHVLREKFDEGKATTGTAIFLTLWGLFLGYLIGRFFY